ncbi:MAG: hypothetical protein E2603_03290 [Achromobacter sp.]|nr:hypothetical protein [Achromobacter sp.]
MPGYRAGAFTGSSKAGARGRILEADGGTLFLEEIGDMPLGISRSTLHRRMRAQGVHRPG